MLRLRPGCDRVKDPEKLALRRAGIQRHGHAHSFGHLFPGRAAVDSPTPRYDSTTSFASSRIGMAMLKRFGDSRITD
jgi:hypothetical protein